MRVAGKYTLGGLLHSEISRGDAGLEGKEKLWTLTDQAGGFINMRPSNQQKLALADLQLTAEFPTDLGPILGRKSCQGLNWRGIAVRKMILAAQEDSNGNQTQDFLVAWLAVRKIGSKALPIP